MRYIIATASAASRSWVPIPCSASSRRASDSETSMHLPLAGAQPENRFARSQHKKAPDISVRALFTAYVEHLKVSGKGAWYQVERIFLKRDNNVATFLGPDRLARSI